MVAALVIAIAGPVNGNSIQDTFRWTSAIETLRSGCWFDGISMPDVVGKSNVSVAFCSMTNGRMVGGAEPYHYSKGDCVRELSATDVRVGDKEQG